MLCRFLIFSLTVSAAFASPFSSPLVDMGEERKIAVQNAILAKVNGTTISMMDVKKKMDLVFHQNFPDLLHSPEARCQFYQASWRNVLTEMIDQELIIADAADKEIKLTDAEVREEIENRFGPNVMGTLDQIGVTYDEAWKMVKNDMIVARMTWWFIHSKALASVTPMQIREAYRLYLEKNPPYNELKYQVVTMRGEALAEAAQDLARRIDAEQKSPEELASVLAGFESQHPGVSVHCSQPFTAKDTELSESHRTALQALNPGQHSAPLFQKSRDRQQVCRFFFLESRREFSPPSFEDMAPMLKNELMQKASSEISSNYLGKLRKHYRFDASHLNEVIPENIEPFALR
jgi:hypothetical protein